MKLPCLLFLISISVNRSLGGHGDEGSKPKKLRVEPSDFFTALVHREKEGSTSKKKGTFKLNLLSVTDLESRREYQRLVKIYEQAVGEEWDYPIRRNSNRNPPATPLLSNVGLVAEATFIQFCGGAVVQVEKGLHIMVTSAICGHIIDQVRRQHNNVVDPDADLGENIYHHPYTSGLDPNIAVLKIKKALPSNLVLLRLPSEDDRTVNGTVAWRVAYYEDRHEQDVIPTESFIVPGEIVDSPDSNRNIFIVKINSNKRTIPARDLGGSLFYVRDAQGRPVLKGIRTLLAGDYFTGIAPFADWIRNQTREMQAA